MIPNTERPETDVETMLLALLATQDLLPLSRWPFETARWYEFAASVLRVVGADAVSPRSIENGSEILTRLGFLDVDELVAMANDDTAGTESANLMEVVLVRCGFGREAAHQAVSAIMEAANIISNRYGGRIQMLLRQQGEAMLDSVMAELPLRAVDDDTRRRIVTHWLQRTLDLPIPVSTRGIRLAASAHDATEDELIAAADRLHINIAILDELLARYDREAVDMPARTGEQAR